MKRSQVLVLTGVILVATLSYTWFRTAARAGEFTTLVPVFEGSCQDLGNMPGSEDIAIDRAQNRIFVASDDRRSTAPSATTRGAVYGLSLATIGQDAKPVDLTAGQPKAFHPHGISIFKAANGQTTIMVVNHPRGAYDATGTTVEIFDQQGDGTLKLRRTVAIEGLSRINDIAATGENSFYATSETDFKQGSFSEVFNLITGDDRTGAIWYFDGTKGSKVTSGIGFANSVALSPDGKTLYASGTMSRAVYLYDRDPSSGAIKQRDAALIGSGIDNLDVEPDGTVWMASHPKLLSFIRHARDAKQTAPSQVLILEPSPSGKGGKVDQIYLKDGSDGFSAASVGVRAGELLILGSVFEKGIRVCQLPKVWKQSESHPAQRLLDTERDELAKEAEKAAKTGASGAPK
jgi:arylesterase/paraoxonase